MIADFVWIIFVPMRPILYYQLGRQESNSLNTPIALMSGGFSMVRLWFNLGPNDYTKWGGIGYFLVPLGGVAFNIFYSVTCVEAMHLGIGGCFISAVVPFTIAVRNAQELPV